MPTPTQVAANIVQELMDKGIIALLDPKTKEPVTIQHEAAANLVNRLAYHSYDAIKGINAHRPMDEDALSLSFKDDTQLQQALEEVESKLESLDQDNEDDRR